MNAIPPASTDKATIVAALYKWIRQRPGLEFGAYGDVKNYRAELRSIAKDLQQARAMLRYVEMAGGITGDMIADTCLHAFSGRLRWTGTGFDYCAGQYWPTEYRRAVCAVLAAVIWHYWRDGMTGDNIGDRLRAAATRTFGRGLASRWFR